MEIDAYLGRIGYSGPRTPTAETLRQLHRAHMFAVPFENLDIPLGNPIALSLPAFYAKIVERRRGGFCYELNGLFGWLLEQLGFRIVRLSAGVYGGGQRGARVRPSHPAGRDGRTAAGRRGFWRLICRAAAAGRLESR